MKLYMILFVFVIIQETKSVSVMSKFLTETFGRCNCSWPDNVTFPKLLVYYDNYKSQKKAIYKIKDAATKILSREDYSKDQCIHIFVTPFMDNGIGIIASEFRCMLERTICDNGLPPIALIVDHSAYTNGFFPLNLQLYAEAVSMTNSMGKVIGELIVGLLSKTPKDNIILSGHSYGAQIIAPAAQYVKNVIGPLKVIYSIDPSGICYDNCPDLTIRPGVADTVVAFHCDGDDFGTQSQFVDYNIRVGDGDHQYGCDFGNSSDVVSVGVRSACSHVKCPSLVFEAAINNKLYKATKCDSYIDLKNGNCKNNPVIKAGYNQIPEGPKGIYYMKPLKRVTCGSIIPTRFTEWISKAYQYFLIPKNKELLSMARLKT